MKIVAKEIFSLLSLHQEKKPSQLLIKVRTEWNVLKIRKVKGKIILY